MGCRESRFLSRALETTSGELAVAVLTLAVSCLPAVAQDRPDEGVLAGVVVDAVTGEPISGALVVIDDERRAVLTDSLGAFDLGSMEGGPVSLVARRYGYEMRGMDAVLPNGGALQVEIPLPPKAVLVDGLEVVTERLQTMDQRLTSRRNATATSVRAFEQERLVQSTSRDFLEFLRFEASLYMQPCGLRAFASQCVQRRGRLVAPRVYIDEVPIMGGLDHLASFQPYDLYLVEVYSSGQEIRAYTHLFMDRMAHRETALFPAMSWW
ncbi:MAG: carboxypeptidase regulatory-like domain-containing protein [Gemmatimonadota bacterium]